MTAKLLRFPPRLRALPSPNPEVDFRLSPVMEALARDPEYLSHAMDAHGDCVPFSDGRDKPELPADCEWGGDAA